MNNRITLQIDHGMALILLLVVIWIIFSPKSIPDTEDLIENVKTSDGKTIVTQTNTILHFWSVDCLPCKRDAQVLQRFHRKHEDYQIIGINVDGKERSEDVDQWVKSIHLDYEIAQSEKPILKAKVPSTLVINSVESNPISIQEQLTYRLLLDATEKDR